MSDAPSPDDSLPGLPSRARIAELILGSHPHRNTFPGWQHYRATRAQLVLPPALTLEQWRLVPEARRSDLDHYRRLTNVNLPLQLTPMQEATTKLIRRRLVGNTHKQDDPTLAGVMLSAWGGYGKTSTVCSAVAAFEDYWMGLHNDLIPGSIPGTTDLHAPVCYVATPVTATPRSLCAAILNFFRTETRSKPTLPHLMKLVSDSFRDHGVKVLVLDDISNLRMHRADDQDVLDLIRAFMSLDVTLILVGVNIPATGLLREATWDRKASQWVMPPLESTRIHGLEVTQTEHRFAMVELDRFSYRTPQQIRAFVNHLRGIENHLRLLNARPGMLTEGNMPEYYMRRTGGIVGLIGRLTEDGAQEAMESGREVITEDLLDEIVLQRDDMGPPEEPEVPQDAPAAEAKPAKKKRRPRNTVLDDHGPQAAADRAG